MFKFKIVDRESYNNLIDRCNKVLAKNYELLSLVNDILKHNEKLTELNKKILKNNDEIIEFNERLLNLNRLGVKKENEDAEN